jgi:DNA-binding NarL/FixJ family response regulator
VSYFPLRERTGKLMQVAAIVVEVSERMDVPPPVVQGRRGLPLCARPLSERERQVLQLLADGKNNKQVAEALSIRLRTAETHRARIMLKLGVHSGAELVSRALRSGLIGL